MIFEKPQDLLGGAIVLVLVLTLITLWEQHWPEYHQQPKEQVIETRDPTIYET